MSNEHLLYLQEIGEFPWVIELISEQFGDAPNMMSINSIIYGGAIRDCLAGKKLLGDLDIAIPSIEYKSVIEKFVKSPKWGFIKRSSNYAPLNFSINNKFQEDTPIVSFRTLRDKVVQLTKTVVTINTPLQTVLSFAKEVDIVCCGVLLTNEGRVFETVPGAYEDCKKGLLHLNNLIYVTDLELFQLRIEKLVARGWRNEIDMDKVIKGINKRNRQTKLFKKQDEKTIDNHSIDQKQNLRFDYTIDESTQIKRDGGHSFIIKRNYLITIKKDISTMLFSIQRFAQMYALDILIRVIDDGIIVTTNNERSGRLVHRAINKI